MLIDIRISRIAVCLFADFPVRYVATFVLGRLFSMMRECEDCVKLKGVEVSEVLEQKKQRSVASNYIDSLP
jgi:hypothetical protein